MFDQLSELALLQAYWNDRHVQYVQGGRVLAVGVCRVYEKTPWQNSTNDKAKPGKILCNIKTYDGAWIREIPMNQIRELNEADYLVRKKQEVADDDIPF